MNKKIIKVLKKLGIGYALISAVAFTGCSESVESEIVQENSMNVQTEIDVSDLVGSFSNYFESTNTMTSAFEKLTTSQALNRSKKGGSDVLTIFISTEDVVEYTQADLAEFYSKNQKEFLLDYFNTIANTDDSELDTTIAYYMQELERSNLSGEEYEQINSILDVAQQTLETVNTMLPEDTLVDNAKQPYQLSQDPGTDAFKKCIASKGKTIARALAGGALTGAAWGCLIGGGGGTVVLPGIGTATGCVGGAVFGAAKGAATSTAVSLIWAAADCAHHLGSNGGGASYGLEAAGCDRVTVQSGAHGMVFQVCN